MAEAVYLACAATSLLCAGLLARGYRASGQRLLFWSAFCFGGFALHNLMMFVDFAVVPDTDLSLIRQAIGATSIGVLLFGLVWETP